MRLTADGAAELQRLMTTRLRGPMGEVNKLIIAFKMHFLAALPAAAQAEQLSLLIEACDKELARLGDLRAYPAVTRPDSHLASWLDLEIALDHFVRNIVIVSVLHSIYAPFGSAEREIEALAGDVLCCFPRQFCHHGAREQRGRRGFRRGRARQRSAAFDALCLVKRVARATFGADSFKLRHYP